MRLLIFTVALVVVVHNAVFTSGQGQSVYQYFADVPNPTGMTVDNNEFRLNGKYIRIISGAMHYFRIHPDLWRDRLRKLRAVGANTVETYVPWNLHEPRRGVFDFGNGTDQFSPLLDVRRYLQIAQEEDLLVIFRPGPYICSEWDFGGLPSWLQRDPDMRVRDNYQPYLDRVKIFLDAFLPQVADLQFTQGGSIVMTQIENEYASFGPAESRSREYLEFIRQVFLDNGMDALHFTSDNNFAGDGWQGSIPGILQTANFQSNPDPLFDRLLEIQPNMPIMAMEFWSGWFNHWTDPKQEGSDPAVFRQTLETIFSKYNGSVNFYMFHGGTNFAFMAGGNNQGEAPFIKADITSYDYHAPLSEAGDYTEKYQYAYDLIQQYENPPLRKPLRPVESVKTAYPTLTPQNCLTYDDIVDRIPASHKVQSQRALSMELMPINDGNGQSYGYIIYRIQANINAGDVIRISWPRDIAYLLIDGEQVDTGFTNDQPEYLYNNIREFRLNVTVDGPHVVDVIVEPVARNNFGWAGDYIQQKGIAAVHQSKIEINDVEVEDLEIMAMEFKSEWVTGLTGWRPVTAPGDMSGPCLLQSTFNITGQPADTFLDMKDWHKGIVFVNGFNVGRYWKVGPQQTLYVPAPLLKTGENEIIIFEHLEPNSSILFSSRPNLGPCYMCSE